MLTHRPQAESNLIYRGPHRTLDHRAWEYLWAAAVCGLLGVVLALAAWAYLAGVRGL